MATLLERMINEDVDWLTNALLEEEKKVQEHLNTVLVNFENFLKTGDLIYLQKELDKENCGPIVANKRGRPKRGVLAEINETNNPLQLNGIKIKREKISEAFNGFTQIQTNSESSVASINEEMPPPTKLLPKRKIKKEPVECPKRSTRTKRKPERYTIENVSGGKESDVIIENPKLITVDVTDSDKEIESAEVNSKSENSDVIKQNEPVRSKRTKTIKKANTQAEGITPSLDPEENKTTGQPGHNLTFITSSNPSVINNCTVVLEKHDFNEQKNETTAQTPQKQKKNQKEIFSPFDKVSTKKKIEAFEKLVVTDTTTPPPSSEPKIMNKKMYKEDSKVTPMGSRTLMKINSTTKINREHPAKNSLIPSKSQSALKASQAEFRERLKKKQEKEEEALRKREALLLALTEEKRKKREEKQLKAQQQREMQAIEKQKLMEMQKLKEERYKQALAEKEEKLLQQREEARKRIEESKQRERNMKLQSERPIYLTTPAPLLPTEDCYDSDDEESERAQTATLPSWSKDRELRKMQYVMLKVGESIKNTFFCRQTYTPDLQEIFETIDPRKLKRTSSAIWKKPPRYTLFLESSTVQFSEDDDEN